MHISMQHGGRALQAFDSATLLRQLLPDLAQGGDVLLDMVSLFPAENGAEGATSPFRADLLALLKGLHPKCVARSLLFGVQV